MGKVIYYRLNVAVGVNSAIHGLAVVYMNMMHLTQVANFLYMAVIKGEMNHANNVKLQWCKHIFHWVGCSIEKFRYCW